MTTVILRHGAGGLIMSCLAEQFLPVCSAIHARCTSLFELNQGYITMRGYVGVVHARLLPCTLALRTRYSTAIVYFLAGIIVYRNLGAVSSSQYILYYSQHLPALASTHTIL